MLKAVNLKTEYLINPIGIDIREPKLGWWLEGESRVQTAYEIKAAHSIKELETGTYIWESEKINTSSFTHIAYLLAAERGFTGKFVSGTKKMKRVHGVNRPFLKWAY